MRRTSIKKWRRIGLALKVIRYIMFNVVLPNTGPLPERIRSSTVLKLQRALDGARESLSSRMAEERHGDASLGDCKSAFYPDISSDAIEIGELVERMIIEMTE